ncbi:MAG: EAL domain-containing protein, partial [Actinomycetota bacterium]|nr:EAL domain-containing protein [Actinomycetota bacterium]
MSDGADAPPECATTVVVVDDHPMIVQTMVAIIEAMPGLSAVGWASTAAEGLAAVLAHRPDVVVLDYALPDGQGSDLARGVLRLRPGTKVVMITGASTSRALVDALDAGCHGFLDKGRAAAELVRVLRSVAAGAAQFPDDVLAELPRMDQLVVHYQPIVDLQSESAVGAEALVRWRHPERGLLAPAAFIPQAEETGLVVPLGWRVLAEACRQTAEWHRELPDAGALSISVNVSAQQLAKPDFVERVADALHAGPLPADRLVLELTETGMMDGQAATAAPLEAVRALGVELRLDDFGTGYSSLIKLRCYPIGALKIDRSFVHGMLAHSEDAEIVLASVRLAQSLGIRTVAEGVEEEAEAEKLRSFGCELAQGYLWSRPLSPDAFSASYREWQASHPGESRHAQRARDEMTGVRRHRWTPIRYEHCGWCHLRGAYLVPGRPVLRCKYCQASKAVPDGARGDVERDLSHHTRNLTG